MYGYVQVFWVCACSNRDVYLLDDPFSAVDPDVAESLFQKVVQNALVGKTIILVTHEPQVQVPAGEKGLRGLLIPRIC